LRRRKFIRPNKFTPHTYGCKFIRPDKNTPSAAAAATLACGVPVCGVRLLVHKRGAKFVDATIKKYNK
jgi:hypothetical protein